MRLVVPISRSDSHLLPQWIEVHEALKTAGLNHQLFFVVPQPIASEAHDAKARLNDLFEEVTVHQIDYEPYGGHPQAPNMHFYECASLMNRLNPNIPWQLVELDCLPRTANAYDAIASRYASCGAQFFGYMDKTPWRVTEEFVESGKDKDGKPIMVRNPHYGKIIGSLYGDGDLMMSGCAVYPGNMIQRQNFSGLMADFMKGSDSPQEAWDIYLRSAMANDGMAHTNLIASKWNTCNYRVENGVLTCDSMPSHEIFDRNPEWVQRQCGGPVHSEAVLIHGCKDDSLFKLIVSGAVPEVLAPQKTVQSEPSGMQHIDLPNNQPTYRLDSLEEAQKKLEAGQNQIMLMLQQVVAKISSPPDGTQGEPAAAAGSSVHETKEAGDSSLLDLILSALPEIGKKQMLSALSKSLSADKAELKATIQSSGKFAIKGPAEWVERIAA